jgi:hypothetical protein
MISFSLNVHGRILGMKTTKVSEPLPRNVPRRGAEHYAASHARRSHSSQRENRFNLPTRCWGIWRKYGAATLLKCNLEIRTGIDVNLKINDVQDSFSPSLQ